jgi:hypothetical protein
MESHEVNVVLLQNMLRDRPQKASTVGPDLFCAGLVVMVEIKQ